MYFKLGGWQFLWPFQTFSKSKNNPKLLTTDQEHDFHDDNRLEQDEPFKTFNLKDFLGNENNTNVNTTEAGELFFHDDYVLYNSLL